MLAKLATPTLAVLVTCSLLCSAQSSGISYTVPASQATGAKAEPSAFPGLETTLAPENVTGSVPDNFQPPSLLQDKGVLGPPIEVVHYYYDQWPIGLAVLPGQEILACYTRGDYPYTLGKVVNITAEEAYPTSELNLPVDAIWDHAVSNITGYAFGSNSSDHLINVQALYQSPDGDVWVLDTGRPTVTTSDGSSVIAYAQVGGPKLIRLAANGTFDRVYTFPGNVHYPSSSMNDVRFDMRRNVTESGKGIAYIVDSSDEGRNGFIVLDLGTGKSWRRLTQHPSTLHVYGNRPSYLGQPFYQITKGQSRDFTLEGFDGLALSPDGEWAYYAPLNSNYLYRVPTAYLRVDDSGPNPQRAETDASDNVHNLGQKGSQTNGFEADTNGIIYQAAPEQNAILAYDPATKRMQTFVRDPRLAWVDSIVIADDGYLYGNVNQLFNQKSWQNGTDERQKPGFMFRAKLPNGGTRITQSLMG